MVVSLLLKYGSHITSNTHQVVCNKMKYIQKYIIRFYYRNNTNLIYMVRFQNLYNDSIRLQKILKNSRSV